MREILSALPVLPDKKANINSAACKLASVGSMRGRYERFRADPSGEGCWHGDDQGAGQDLQASEISGDNNKGYLSGTRKP